MTEFRGNLGNYKILKTEDNSETIWSEFFDEACHNLSGAYEETLHNYIHGCLIPERLNQKTNFAVLDVGFGVGVGLKAFIDQIKLSKSHNTQLSYYSIELDETLLLWSLKETLPDIKLSKNEQFFEAQNLIFYEGVWDEKLEIKIFVGDGRLTLPLAEKLKLLNPIDAIFQDAFSPRKNPMLWSVEWFVFLKKISAQTVQLSTYSSSISIRKSLVVAGWIVSEAQGFAKKRFMTKAQLLGHTNEELLLKLTRSPSLEIRDK